MDKILLQKFTLKELLGDEWFSFLHKEFEKDYMQKLSEFVLKERKNKTIYPKSEDVFKAFNLTQYSKVRICIIGQDPYINEDEAHGLAFSTKKGTSTPSLRSIEKAVREQVYNNYEHYAWYNNLERWANQGVFLLNTVLTVEKGKSNSHKDKGWEQFTSNVIELLDRKGSVVFLLWGKKVQENLKIIKNSKTICCEDPVAAKYRGGTWDNNDCFNKAASMIEGRKIQW